MSEVPVAAPTRRTAADPPSRPAPPAVRQHGRVAELTDMARLAFNAQVTRRHPVSLVHFVTRRCNARCSFCFIDFDNPSPRSAEMTLEEIDSLTRTLGPVLSNVNLTGGEPFLRSDLGDIARCYYRNAGVRSVYITSNGYFTDRIVTMARDVASEFPDRSLIISLSVDAFPEEHDRIRRVKGLFERVIRTYHELDSIGANVMVNVGITVSHENHSIVADLYDSLVNDHGIRSITAIIVRDEGVHVVPKEHREQVLDTYRWLTDRIVADQRTGRIQGYDPDTLQGRLMNRKNEMLYDIVLDTYLDPHFVTPCRAGALFGVIDADASVHPCEVLDRPLGNLRDHDMDFGVLWSAAAAAETRRWIVDSECHCSYECALGFNILGNARYQPKLVAAALGR